MSAKIVYRNYLQLHIDDELDNWLKRKVIEGQRNAGVWKRYTKADLVRGILRAYMEEDIKNA